MFGLWGMQYRIPHVFAAGEVVSNHDELMSNFFAQPDALAYGKVCFMLTPGHWKTGFTFEPNTAQYSKSFIC